jgi:hypothetical protein
MRPALIAATLFLAAASASSHATPPSRWRWLPDYVPPAAAKTTIAALPRSTSDRLDDVSGPQLHLMYVLAADGPDEHADTDGRIATSVTAFNEWLLQQTPGRRLRLDTYQGLPDVTFYRLSRTDAQLRATGAFVRNEIENELRTAGVIRNDKLYAVYYGGTSTYSCGGGAYPPSLPGNVGAIYLHGEPPGAPRCDTNPLGSSVEVPGYFEFAMLHELLHTVGFVAVCAPHHHLAGHVSDSSNDLMWSGSNDFWHLPPRLDIGRDDYYQHSLAGCLDFSASAFLDAVPAVTPATGIWWNPDESGTGYAIDVQHGVLAMLIFSYQVNGAPEWYYVTGPLTNNGRSFSSTLDKYRGGQCISCPYTGRPTLPGNDGPIAIEFSSSTRATLSLPGGRRVAIQPMAF